MSSDHSNFLSKMATGNGHHEDSLYFHGWKAYRDDPFHLKKNPKGVIQMGLAENQLCFDLIKRWVLRNPGASICTPEGVEEFMATAIYQDYHGLPEFRNGVANFMGKVRGDKVKFDPDRIVMSGGATGAHETIAFCLADRGDAFLVPTPYYPGFDRDLRWRTGVQFVPVVCDSSNDFKLTLPALETAYEEAKASNINVKGLLITNPSNPLGTTLDPDTLRGLLAFSTDKNIHLVCDEIYAATVFTGPSFTSIAEIVEEQPQCNRNLVHIVYSLSKDMGFPGFRVGVVYSYNDAVVSCARKMSSFGLVSTQTQRLLAAMLTDDEFVDEFVAESGRRLAARRGAFVRGLGEVGIRCLDSNAGLFFWMDLRGLLEEATVEAETKLWLVILGEVKLNVSPGTSFHCPEPGWFRVCFANMDEEAVRVALWRIRKFVLRDKETKAPSKKRCRAARLQLSLSFRGLEDPAMSPAHSPLLPTSPLVRMFGQGHE